VATAVLDAVAPLPRRLADGRLVSGHHPVARPRDPLGLPISTTAEAAAAYNAGLERVMLLQAGGEELLRKASELDPDFAMAHAALAMLGHEAGAEADVEVSLEAARRAVRTRGDDRERSLVNVVGLRVKDVQRTGTLALMSHIASYPRDVLAVSAAVPTIAFSGVTDVQQEAWDLVEGLAPAYGDHWWYISLLAFTRQDQSRFEEAGLLAESALSCEPSSGHAVHAQTHVLYETGEHETGRVWLDHWVNESGRSASHRAHFSWHAALHELAIGDTEAVRRRYYSQLAPPAVTGVRALIDSASLLWRWRVTTSEWDGAVDLGVPGAGKPVFAGETAAPPVESVVEAVDAELLSRPQTPFVALHAAVALAGAGDIDALQALAKRCRQSRDSTAYASVAAVCDALTASAEGRWAAAAEILADVMPTLTRVGGSAAQREIVEETLLFCLVSSGQAERALALLDQRLDRRSSPLDRRRQRSLSPVGADLSS
jgi:predicted negative regulator of RcsB-dependent stress response